MLLQKLSFKTQTKRSCCQWPALHGPIRAQHPDGFSTRASLAYCGAFCSITTPQRRRTYLSRRNNNNNTDQTDPSHGTATAQPAQLLPWFRGSQTIPHSNAQLQGRTMASVGAAWQRTADSCLFSMFDKWPWGKTQCNDAKRQHTNDYHCFMILQRMHWVLLNHR